MSRDLKSLETGPQQPQLPNAHNAQTDHGHSDPHAHAAGGDTHTQHGGHSAQHGHGAQHGHESQVPQEHDFACEHVAHGAATHPRKHMHMLTHTHGRGGLKALVLALGSFFVAVGALVLVLSHLLTQHTHHNPQPARNAQTTEPRQHTPSQAMAWRRIPLEFAMEPRNSSAASVLVALSRDEQAESQPATEVEPLLPTPFVGPAVVYVARGVTGVTPYLYTRDVGQVWLAVA